METNNISHFAYMWLEKNKVEWTLGTYERYEGAFRNYVDKSQIGYLEIRQVTHGRIRAYIVDLTKKGFSAGQIKLLILIINGALELAENCGTGPGKITETSHLVKVKRNEDKRVLTRDETDSILTVARGSHIYQLVLLLFTSGIKIGEALGLDRDDIDHNRCTISVTKTYRNEILNKDIRNKRVIEISTGVMEEIKKITSGLVVNGPVFVAKRGGRLGQNSTRYTWANILEKASVQYLSIKHIGYTRALRLSERPTEIDDLCNI